MAGIGAQVSERRDDAGPSVEPASPPTVGRRISHRRTLPNSRAVVGALLVTAAATGAFLVATRGQEEPDTSYLVLRSSVAVGDPVNPSDVAAVALDLGDVVARSAVPSSTAITGAVALRDLRPGELLAADDLLAATATEGDAVAGVHELTLPVPGEWSPEFLLPGDRVTILATTRDAMGDTTVVATEDAAVLRFETGGSGIGPASTARLTLALEDPETVVDLTHLAQLSALTVVRSTRAIADRYPEAAETQASSEGVADER